MVLENIYGKFSPSLKIMAKNIFHEPQPDSASYTTTQGLQPLVQVIGLHV